MCGNNTKLSFGYNDKEEEYDEEDDDVGAGNNED